MSAAAAAACRCTVTEQADRENHRIPDARSSAGFLSVAPGPHFFSEHLSLGSHTNAHALASTELIPFPIRGLPRNVTRNKESQWPAVSNKAACAINYRIR